MFFKKILELLIILVALTPHIGLAESVQKLIIIEGTESRLMDGDIRPQFNFKRDEALPYYLARGWLIRSVHINENSQKNNIFGYVVIEKGTKTTGLRQDAPLSFIP